MDYKESNSQILVDTIVEGMQENKAQDITILDLREIPSAVADFFVISSGESSTQVDGIVSSLVRHTRKEIQDRPWHIEGKGASEWVLVDYVSVVAHVFYKTAREFYDLETLWVESKRTNVPNLD